MREDVCPGWIAGEGAMEHGAELTWGELEADWEVVPCCFEAEWEWENECVLVLVPCKLSLRRRAEEGVGVSRTANVYIEYSRR